MLNAIMCNTHVAYIFAARLAPWCFIIVEPFCLPIKIRNIQASDIIQHKVIDTLHKIIHY